MTESVKNVLKQKVKEAFLEKVTYEEMLIKTGTDGKVDYEKADNVSTTIKNAGDKLYGRYKNTYVEMNSIPDHGISKELIDKVAMVDCGVSSTIEYADWVVRQRWPGAHNIVAGTLTTANNQCVKMNKCLTTLENKVAKAKKLSSLLEEA